MSARNYIRLVRLFDDTLQNLVDLKSSIVPSSKRAKTTKLDVEQFEALLKSVIGAETFEKVVHILDTDIDVRDMSPSLLFQQFENIILESNPQYVPYEDLGVTDNINNHLVLMSFVRLVVDSSKRRRSISVNVMAILIKLMQQLTEYFGEFLEF